jgi:hypothetical protein
MTCSPPTHPPQADSFKAQSTQRTLSFSFTVERTVNENHPKLRFTWFVSQEKTLCVLGVSSEAGGTTLDGHAIYSVHPLVFPVFVISQNIVSEEVR